MSNCDSDGCPIDHDGSKLEDGVFAATAPFAIRSDVFQEIMSGSGKEVTGSHLEATALDGEWSMPSALDGGIPVEKVTIEDYVSSDEESPSPLEAMGYSQSTTSATVQAMLRSSKHEREALIATRSKLSSVLKFLRSKGYSEERVYKELSLDGFGSQIPVRDEFGLPKLVVSSSEEKISRPGINPLQDKMKQKMSESSAEEVLDELTHSHFAGNLKDNVGLMDAQEVAANKRPNMAATKGDGVEKSGDLKGDAAAMGQQGSKSWANVLRTEVEAPVKFSFFPPGKYTLVIDPPLEVLKQGNEK